MEHRFLSLDDSSLLLDRLLQKEGMTGDSEEMTFFDYGLGSLDIGAYAPFCRMEGNSVITERDGEKVSPNQRYSDPGMTDGLYPWGGRTGHPSFGNSELTTQGIHAAVESLKDGPVDLLANPNGGEELKLQNFPRKVDISDDKCLEMNFLQALQVVCCGRIGPPVTIQEGLSVLGMETIKLLFLGAEVFSLVNGSITNGSWCDALWQHSLRAGFMARSIAEGEGADTETIHQACAAGVLHDLGILVFTNSLQDAYRAIRTKAQREACPLAGIEQSQLGLSHGEAGACLLQRWGVSDAVVEAVAFHDEPFRSPTPGFTPLTAVYVANILDGGGWPQDGDGVPAEQALEYLNVRGLVDHWPKWQKWLRLVTPLYPSI